jgi:nucleoside-diphosphate-sugar epimerase
MMLGRPERADELKTTEGALMDWKGSPTVVTGGASFIGSHLVEALLGRGASVCVVDNLSSGPREPSALQR